MLTQVPVLLVSVELRCMCPGALMRRTRMLRFSATGGPEERGACYGQDDRGSENTAPPAPGRQSFSNDNARDCAGMERRQQVDSLG